MNRLSNLKIPSVSWILRSTITPQKTTNPNFLARTFSAEAVKEPVVREGLGLTDSCVEQLKNVTNNGQFLRVTVEGGGCSGFSYKFCLDKELEEDDKEFSRDGVRVVTDVDSYDLLKGSKVDYAQEMIRSAFRIIENPQSTTNCSCGVSFAIDVNP